MQTALGGFQSIHELVLPGGRLYKARQTVLDAIDKSRYLTLVKPRGSMYAFIGVDKQVLPDFDDNQFALDLLEQHHVLVAPGTSFNTDYNNYFRITTLPTPTMLAEVFERIETLLAEYAHK